MQRPKYTTIHSNFDGLVEFIIFILFPILDGNTVAKTPKAEKQALKMIKNKYVHRNLRINPALTSEETRQASLEFFINVSSM